MQNKNIKENKINLLKNILPKINLENTNFKIVNSNIDTLITVFDSIKSIYSSLPSNINEYKVEYNLTDSKAAHSARYDAPIGDSNLRAEINKYIQHYSDMTKSSKLKLTIKKFNKIFYIQYEDLYFFYIYSDENFLKKDLNKIFQMFKIFITLTKYVNSNNNQTRYAIWIPIDSDRDYEFNKIDKEKLKLCEEEYKAFTISGVTHSIYPNPRITIITRYEEIEKLLIHELIHNLHLDGSNYHTELKNIIEKYNKVKNNNNYNYEFSIYESYTELLSTYLYLLFKNINKNYDELKNILLGQILIEIIYSYNTIVNIAKLNGYKNYNDFIKSQYMMGSICFYEYYYVKGLLYNYLLLTFPKNLKEFTKLYENIIKIIKNSYKDKLLEQMFQIYQKQKNFKYIMN